MLFKFFYSIFNSILLIEEDYIIIYQKLKFNKKIDSKTHSHQKQVQLWRLNVESMFLAPFQAIE